MKFAPLFFIFIKGIPWRFLLLAGERRDNNERRICMENICTARDNIIIVSLQGDLDHHVTEKIREEIDKMVSSRRIFTIAFDFRNVSFMDSSGIGLIMGRYKRIKPAGGEIYVSNLNCRLQRIFGLSGLNGITKQSHEIDCVINNEALPKRNIKEVTYEQD